MAAKIMISYTRALKKAAALCPSKPPCFSERFQKHDVYQYNLPKIIFKNNLFIYFILFSNVLHARQYNLRKYSLDDCSKATSNFPIRRVQAAGPSLFLSISQYFTLYKYVLHFTATRKYTEFELIF